ncbi:MAG: response regulator [Elusimicrobia bacterium]|nr:response regulator [Elusimicrobiota bacterium]
MKKKVLVADDDAAVRGVIRRALRDLDCVVIEAADGSEVLGIVEKLRPAVVLLDIHMPELDGIAVVDDISHAHPDVRVIVVSGDATEKRARLAMERGARDFVAKPIDLDYLRRTVEANLLASG